MKTLARSIFLMIVFAAAACPLFLSLIFQEVTSTRVQEQVVAPDQVYKLPARRTKLLGVEQFCGLRQSEV